MDKAEVFFKRHLSMAAYLGAAKKTLDHQSALIAPRKERYETLSPQGDPLEMIGNHIPWHAFRPLLKRIGQKERKSIGLFLFKMDHSKCP